MLRVLVVVLGLLSSDLFVHKLPAQSVSPRPPSILVITSYSQGYRWSDDELLGLLRKLSSRYSGIEPVIEHLDSRRFKQEDRQDELLSGILFKSGLIKPELIITLDNAAFDFVLNHRVLLGAEVPVVFGGLNRFSPDMIKGVPHITGVSEESSYEGTFSLIASLCPKVRNVLLISNQSQNGRETRRVFEQQMHRYSSVYHFEFYDDWANAELIQRLSQLPDDWVGMVLEANQDRTGHQNYNDAEFSRQLSTLNRRPIFINAQASPQNDWTMGSWNGIGGGLVVAELHGEKVGELALRVLDGEEASSIPVITNTPVLLSLDYRHLKRFGLESVSLPAGTVVFNEPNSFYKIHRAAIIIVLVILVVLAGAVVVLSTNIILRRRAEAALRGARAELDLLAKGIAQATDIILLLSPEGELRYANPAFERLCGLAPRSWLGQRLDVVMPGLRDKHSLSGMMQEAAAKAGWSGVLEIHPDQESPVLLQARIAPVEASANEAVLYVFIGRDITREAKLEEQLRSSQKLEAVGLLAGGVAHDFNNILQIIQGHSALLLEELIGTPQADGIAEIREASLRATQLTRQLLVFSRRQTMNWEYLDPSQLVADMLKMLRRLIGEHIEVCVKPSVDAFFIHADKGQLEQVLLNLCVNARDAMPQGGRLYIDLGRIDFAVEDCEEYPGLEAGAYMELAVRDTGCGMSAEVLSRIFEPFYTTKPVGKGTGLGLSVVYGIIKNHKGLVRVYSEPGRGSVFKVYLPLAHVGRPSEPVADTAPIPAGHGLILLAEDDAPVQLLATRILTRHGYEVLVASDGEQAQALIARHHARLRLAVLDVMMPKLSGRQVYEYIHAQHPQLPVLFCSGYTADMLPPEMAPEEGLALINKPYASRDLLLSIERLLAGRS